MSSQIELSTYFQALSRQQIELILVQLVMKHENAFGLLEQQLDAELDANELESEIADVVESTADVADALARLEPWLERAQALRTVQRPAQSLVVLKALTSPLVLACSEIEANDDEKKKSKATKRGKKRGGDEGKTSTEAVMDFWAQLESEWEKSLEAWLEQGTAPSPASSSSSFSSSSSSSSPSSSSSSSSSTSSSLSSSSPSGETLEDDVKQWFTLLAGWRVTLAPQLGPLLSDPLRTLKVRIRTLLKRKQSDDSAPASASAAAPKKQRTE